MTTFYWLARRHTWRATAITVGWRCPASHLAAMPTETNRTGRPFSHPSAEKRGRDAHRRGGRARPVCGSGEVTRDSDGELLAGESLRLDPRRAPPQPASPAGFGQAGTGAPAARSMSPPSVAGRCGRRSRARVDPEQRAALALLVAIATQHQAPRRCQPRSATRRRLGAARRAMQPRATCPAARWPLVTPRRRTKRCPFPRLVTRLAGMMLGVLLPEKSFRNPPLRGGAVLATRHDRQRSARQGSAPVQHGLFSENHRPRAWCAARRRRPARAPARIRAGRRGRRSTIGRKVARGPLAEPTLEHASRGARPSRMATRQGAEVRRRRPRHGDGRERDTKPRKGLCVSSSLTPSAWA
jgi:hypothetical protein